MDVDLAYLALCACAGVVMIYALYRVLALRMKVRGGMAKGKVNLLIALVGLMAVCTLYLAYGHYVTPGPAQETVIMITGILLFMMALFVVVVLDLFHTIVKELGL